MRKFQKTLATICIASLFVIQTLPGLNFNNNKAEAATYPASMQEIMSRPYPHVMGNQWGVNSNGTFSAGNNSGKITFIAQYLDYITLNDNGDLFLDNYNSTHNPATGELLLRNNIYSAASAVGRRVYVLPYHNMTDVWNYESVNSNPSWNFWLKPDGQNIGSYDYEKNHNLFLKSDSGAMLYYGNNSSRPFADSRNATWQTYYANHAAGIVSQGFDGLFTDNWLRSPSGGLTSLTSSEFSQVMQGWNTIGGKVKTAIGSSKILIGNSPPSSSFTTRDVAMLEDRIAPTGSGDSSVPSYLSYSDLAASMGQACQDTYWDESKGAFETFRLPMNLLTDNVFGIPTNTAQGSTLESAVEPIIVKLGKIGYPKGARYSSQGILMRDYDSAKVVMNNTGSTVTITLPAGTYKDLEGNAVTSLTLSAYSGRVLKTTSTPPVVTVPTAPTTLAAGAATKDATSGNYSIKLTWTDNSSNETGFKVYQSNSLTGAFNLITTTAANATSYTVNLGATPTAGTYYYKVTAADTAGESAATNIANVPVTITPTVTVPTAPTNASVTGVTKGATSGIYYVNLQWTDNSSNETGFNVYQSTSATGTFNLVATTAAKATTYAVSLGTSPTAGTYYYKITAANTAGESAATNTVSTVFGAPTAPSTLTMTGVTKGATTGIYYVNLKWTDNSSNETGFNVYKSTSATGTFSLVATTAANATTYAVSLGTAPASGTYYYKVTAVGSMGESAATNTVSTTIGVPVAPTSLKVTNVYKATTGAYFVNLTWVNSATNQTGFQIYQSINSATNFQVIKTPAATATGYGINVGTAPTKGTYYYKIVALNSYGQSLPSNTVTATVP